MEERLPENQIPTSAAASPASQPDAALDMAFAGLAAQARMLASGKISSRELVELSLQRIEDSAADAQCLPRDLRAEQALREADAADMRLDAGDGRALLGVPIAIKDDVDLAGQTTPFGCGGEHQPVSEDAELVRRLRGRRGNRDRQDPGTRGRPVALHRVPNLRRDPKPVEHRAHSGRLQRRRRAAVAAGLVAAAIGSDGAGSVRIPAAWTGLVGLKPQRGRISTWPEAEAFNGLTCFGPLTRSVADAALLLDVVAGNREGDLHRPPPHSESFAAAADRATATAADRPLLRDPARGRPTRSIPRSARRPSAAPSSFAELGHEVVAADPSYGLVGLGIIPRGMGGVHDWLRDRVPDRTLRLSRAHGSTADSAGLLSGPPLRAARAAEPALARRIGRIFDRVDVLLRRPRRSHRRGSAPWMAAAIGRRARGQRCLSLRLGLERNRLARAQPAGRASPPQACRSACSCWAGKTTRRRCWHLEPSWRRRPTGSGRSGCRRGVNMR